MWPLDNNASDKDGLLGVAYSRLLIEAERCLQPYVEANGIDDFRYLFRSFQKLNDDALNNCNTPKDIFHELEKIGELGIHNTKILRVIARELNLRELEKEVIKYEEYIHQQEGKLVSGFV